MASPPKKPRNKKRGYPTRICGLPSHATTPPAAFFPPWHLMTPKPMVFIICYAFALPPPLLLAADPSKSTFFLEKRFREEVLVWGALHVKPWIRTRAAGAEGSTLMVLPSSAPVPPLSNRSPRFPASCFRAQPEASRLTIHRVPELYVHTRGPRYDGSLD